MEDFRGKVLKTHSHNIYHFWRCCVPSKYPGSSWGILEATRGILEVVFDAMTSILLVKVHFVQFPGDSTVRLSDATPKSLTAKDID